MTSTSDSDLELLQGVANGERRAFGSLYDRYGAPLYNYLVRLLHETAVAEELTQEVFLGAWQAAQRFQGRSTVKTWLFRIAHHQAVSWLRRHGEGRQPAAFEDLEDLPSLAPDPEDQLLSALQAADSLN